MDLIKEKFHIICARYNEDIRWLLPYKHITTVYNKGDYDPILNKFESINIDNVGRESHTYLYHIINNYDNLSDKNIFFQGKINDHKILDIEDYFGNEDFIGKSDILNITKLSKKIDHYGKYLKEKNNFNMSLSKYNPLEWIKKIVGLEIGNINEVKIVWGANFSVSKKLIHSKPKVFYENILRYIEHHSNPEEGHFLERSWNLIFHSNYIPKKNIYFIFFKKYNENVEKIISKINNVYENIHIWFPIHHNIDIGKHKNIYYTPNNFKYITIYPELINNQFSLGIKGGNDAHILIEFDKYEEKYEIVLGGWNNNTSVIRDNNNNKIISSYDKKILDINSFINFDFSVSTLEDNKIKVILNNQIILQHDHIFEGKEIKNIKIKSCFNSNIYWQYNNLEDDNIKYFLCVNNYENIKKFYLDNYEDNYVHEINIFDFI